ncbi:MAG: NAD(P)/FAD-dependent oxidoreductase, partial [Candidatus Cryptobacteroides sp.]
HRSSDVVDTLVRAATRAGAQILCGKEVCGISREMADAPDNQEAGGNFTVDCADGSSYSCRSLIIASGGLSYPGTGSTGDGYGWAEGLGIEVTPLFPSLTAIVPEGYKVDNPVKIKGILKGYIDRGTPLSENGAALVGIQLKNVGLTVYVDGNAVQEEFGDLDFTDGGIEGPIGFKVSRRCVRALMNGSRVTASIDLKPAVHSEDLETRIKALWKEISEDRRSNGKSRNDLVRVLLGKLLPSGLVGVFLRQNPETDFRRLAKRLKDWRMEIEGYVGYERCVITAGGICQEEIVAKTLESRKVPGLYFAGEILDLDADTGGYNLQTAFSTGFLAGESAALRNMKK